MTGDWPPKEGDEVYVRPLDMFGKLMTIVNDWYHVITPIGEHVCRIEELERGAE